MLTRRVITVFAKDLKDILRDRRTLTAMIVVPIVLYPLLTLGSLQAVQQQMGQLELEQLVVGVIREEDQQTLQRMIEIDLQQLTQEHEAWTEESGEPLPPEPIRRVDFQMPDHADAAERENILRDAVRNRGIHVAIILPEGGLVNEEAVTNEVRILFDSEQVRSAMAARRMSELLSRRAEQVVENRLKSRRLPVQLTRPFAVARLDLAESESMLGHILPLVLVLMTITGAIYPAIDLTAGERERNTLESLLGCPVSTLDLIAGKFMVVTVVAVMGAALNLASVSATLYFGGLSHAVMAGGGSGGAIPISRMLFILVALVPFAVLMSAVMIAVCSLAHTFKEAQNYVTPVILAVLVPGGMAALPTSQLDGVMLVMPVGNMVLLSREVLVGVSIPAWKIVMVMLSTTLYAGAAVALASQVFRNEAVFFSDGGSWAGLFNRRVMRPVRSPAAGTSLMLVALLFPVWFFIQTSLSQGEGGPVRLLQMSAILMPLIFVGLPALVLGYFKIDLVETFALRWPSMRMMLAGLLFGLAMWVPAAELSIFQQQILPVDGLLEANKTLVEALRGIPWWMSLLVIAVVPAVSEELLFRGYLLSGLRRGGGKWLALLASSAMFALFHFLLVKFAVTMLLGLVLAWLCWQSRSILPGIVAHAVHNGLNVSLALWPSLAVRLGVDEEQQATHLPIHLLVGSAVLLVVAYLLAKREAEPKPGPVTGSRA